MKGRGGRSSGPGGRPPRDGSSRGGASHKGPQRQGSQRPGASRAGSQRSGAQRRDVERRDFDREDAPRQGAPHRDAPRGPRPEPRRSAPAGRSGGFDRRDREERRPARFDEERAETRSFDGSPRRRRDRDWDIGDDGGWAPEADLDLADVTEPRGTPRRHAGAPGESERRGDRAERPERDRDAMARGPRRSEKPQGQPAAPTRRELKAAATETLQTGVQTLTVTGDEDDMRVDRFLAARFPQLSFSYIQRIVRKGELRVNGKRVETKDRLEQGQAVRVPPLKLDQPRPVSAKAGEDTKGFLASITLYEDSDVIVFAKPAGLAVQGGSGTKKHLDGMLAVLTDAEGQRPRLVHRLDKDTSGCILVAKSRFAAAALAKTFRTRAARKIYWAVVAGVPKPRQGRVSTYLAKEEREDESRMRLAKHGEKGASHAVSYYATIDTMAQKLSWLSMKPVTGRTHQLRVHAAEIGHPIIGDPKYFDVQNWEIPGGVQNKLHLHARRLVVPHPRGKGTIDVSAPLPPHMEQTFNLLGWDVSRYDPIVEAPEE